MRRYREKDIRTAAKCDAKLIDKGAYDEAYKIYARCIKTEDKKCSLYIELFGPPKRKL